MKNSHEYMNFCNCDMYVRSILRFKQVRNFQGCDDSKSEKHASGFATRVKKLVRICHDMFVPWSGNCILSI